MNKKIILSICVFGVVVLSSTVLAGTWSDWESKYEGIWYRTYDDTDLLTPQRYYAVRIDLENPKIEFVISEGNGDAPHEFTRQTVSDFMDDYNVKIAVNANFFNNEDYPVNTNALGTVVSGGTRYSDYDSGYPIELRIMSDNYATILDTTFSGGGLYHAVAGKCWVARNGENVAPTGNFIPGDFHGWPNARTSIGLTEDQRFMIILAVDGGGSLDATGVTSAGLGDIMLWLGCDDAVMMDGGGSTQLCGQWAETTTNLLNVPDETPTRTVPVSLGADSVSYNPRLDVVALTEQSQDDFVVYRKYWSKSDGWSTNWANLGKPSCGINRNTGVACVSRKPYSTDIFVIGNDNKMYRTTYTSGSGYSAWTYCNTLPTLPDLTYFGTELDACAMNKDRIDVILGTSNNRIYCTTSYDGGLTWATWNNMSGNVSEWINPSIVSWGDGRLDIFAGDSNSSGIKHRYYQEGSGWSSWLTYPGDVGLPGIDATSQRYGEIDIFYAGMTQSEVYERSYTAADGWSVTATHSIFIFPLALAAGSYEENSKAFFGVQSDRYDPDIVRKMYADGWSVVSDTMGHPGWGYTQSLDACSWSNDAATHYEQ